MKKLLAIVGVILIIGGVGTTDYMVELGLQYPLYKTAIVCLLGLAMMIPAYLEVINGEK